MRDTLTLRSGVVLDMARRGHNCIVTLYGGEKVPRVVVGEFDTWDGHRIHIATAEALAQWNGDAYTIPGLAFRAECVEVLP